MASIETPNIFAPVSTPAFEIRDLSFIVLAITGAIFLIVGGFAVYTLIRFGRRPTNPEVEAAQVYGSTQIELAWAVVPLLIVVVLFLITARYVWGIERRPKPPNALEITVVGNQWWWEVRYPKLGVLTANEIHAPVSAPADPALTFITLQSVDVAHSFWVPQLAGKMDVIPNKTNRVWIEPRRAGTFVGQCAEYCGLQHALMLLVVVVHPKDEFRAWIAAQQVAPTEQTAARVGRELFSSLACVNCHRVHGTPGNGGFGPDLTHLMSRAPLGAGAVRSTPENLRAWVMDPGAFKVGALMPAMKLDDAQLDQLVAYLVTLR